jgi:hypothetical protein
MTWFAAPLLIAAIFAAVRGTRLCSRSFRSPGHARQRIGIIGAWRLPHPSQPARVDLT